MDRMSDYNQHRPQFRNVILQLMPLPPNMHFAAVFERGEGDPYRNRPAPRRSVVGLALVRVEKRTPINDWCYHASEVSAVVLSNGQFEVTSDLPGFDEVVPAALMKSTDDGGESR